MQRTSSERAASPSPPPLPPARILALAVIGVLILSLGYLRFAPDSGSVSVPAAAHAGDLTLKPCSYATEDGAMPDFADRVLTLL